MPTFSIYSPTIDPVETPFASTPASPVPAVGLPAAMQPAIVQPANLQQPSLSVGAARPSPQPAMRVVMRVPDLAAAPAVARGKRSTLADAMYWAIIAAGTVIAMWLIWQGEASPNGAPDDIIPNSTQPAPSEVFQRTLLPSPAEEPPAAQPAGVFYTARALEEPRPRTMLPEMYPPAARPGEAAPLGTIITTQVQP